MLFPLARMGVGQRASFDPFDRLPGTMPGTGRAGRLPGTMPGTGRTGRGWGEIFDILGLSHSGYLSYLSYFNDLHD